MKKYLVLLVPLLFLMAQCSKDDSGDETLVEGVVMEYGTNKPIPNVPIKIRSISGEVFGSLKYQYTGDSTLTDSKGKYSIRFRHTTRTTYDAVWIEKRYTGDNGAVLDNGKRNRFDFVLNPPAWVKFYVKNELNPQSNDTIRLTGHLFSGANINETYLTQVFGNKREVFYWWVKKAGSSTIAFKDSIYCPAFDTVTYTIKY